MKVKYGPRIIINIKYKGQVSSHLMMVQIMLDNLMMERCKGRGSIIGLRQVIGMMDSM